MHFSLYTFRFFANIRNSAHRKWHCEDAENPRVLGCPSFPHVIHASATLQVPSYEGFSNQFSLTLTIKRLKIVPTIVQEHSYVPGFVAVLCGLLKINQENGAIPLNEHVIWLSIT